jgi:hypothetical protein
VKGTSAGIPIANSPVRKARNAPPTQNNHPMPCSRPTVATTAARFTASRSSTTLIRGTIARSAGEAVMVRMSEQKSQAKRWRR